MDKQPERKHKPICKQTSRSDDQSQSVILKCDWKHCNSLYTQSGNYFDYPFTNHDSFYFKTYGHDKRLDQFIFNYNAIHHNPNIPQNLWWDQGCRSYISEMQNSDPEITLGFHRASFWPHGPFGWQNDWSFNIYPMTYHYSFLQHTVWVTTTPPISFIKSHSLQKALLTICTHEIKLKEQKKKTYKERPGFSTAVFHFTSLRFIKLQKKWMFLWQLLMLM